MIRCICKNCKQEFFIKPSVIKKGNGKYCSKKCLSQMKGALNCTCLNCGAHFHRAPSNLLQGGGKYCSDACLYEHQHPINCVCKYCGKEFHNPPSKNTNGRGKYCSLQCVGKSRIGVPLPESRRALLAGANKGRRFSKEHCKNISLSKIGVMSKDKNPNWKGGITIKRYCEKWNNTLKEGIRDEFGRKCVLCGKPENGRKLSVHHCDYNKMQGCGKNRAWNLVAMCQSCHAKTSYNRWYWFALLYNRWALHVDININGVDLK